MTKSAIGILILANSLLAPDLSFAIQLTNQGCVRNRHDNFSDLRQNVSIFPEDNRGPLSVRGKQEGFSEHDNQKARENIAKLTCPGTTHGNGGSDEAILVGGEDQIVTNAHSFIDDHGLPRDPLSKCFVTFPGHDGADKQKKYLIGLKDGLSGIRELEALGTLRMGDPSKSRAGDYAVAKLVEAVPNVKAYKVGLLPYLHHCESGASDCQHLIMISAISPGMKVKVLANDLVLQSCELRGVAGPALGYGSIMFSNCSGPSGSSSSIAFLKDDDGQLVRGTDGELMPIGILSQSALDKYNGKPYDGVNIWTSSVAFNGSFKAAVNSVAGADQTAQSARPSSGTADQSY